jgi:hypothetical protein
MSTIKINARYFLFLLCSMDFVSQLQTCFGIATNFVNDNFFFFVHQFTMNLIYMKLHT